LKDIVDKSFNPSSSIFESRSIVSAGAIDRRDSSARRFALTF